MDAKGKWIKLYLRGGVYVLPAWVEKPSEAQRVAGKSTSATRSAGFRGRADTARKADSLSVGSTGIQHGTG